MKILIPLCVGDSGGPALYTDTESGTTYQVGIVSWGDACGASPGVFTNLESPIIMNFINQIMCENLAPENCTDEKFYGPQGDFNETVDSSQPQEDAEVDLCKNSDAFYCEEVRKRPRLGCILMKNVCPEICCPNSCDPDAGCLN